MRFVIVNLLLSFFNSASADSVSHPSLFDVFKVCTFSDTELILHKNGTPVSGALVLRTIGWNRERVDEFRTDENGRVFLPARIEWSGVKMLPIEFVAFQQLHVIVDGESVEIWNYAKRNPGINSENSGKPLHLSCDLNAKPETKRALGSVLSTKCAGY